MSRHRAWALVVAVSAATLTAAPSPKRLNSVVTELARVRFEGRPKAGREVAAYAEVPFTRERDGWIYVALDAKVEEGAGVRITLDGAEPRDAILVGAGETMRCVGAGQHRLHIWTTGRPLLESVTVRAVPEIMVYMFEALQKPRPQMWHIHSWEFMESCVLRNCNLIVSPLSDQYAPYAAKWQQRGGRWLGNQGMGQLRKPKVDATQYWAGLLAKPMYDGVIHDELLPQDGSHYERYARCLHRLKAAASAGRKSVYFFSPVSCIPDPAQFAYFTMDTDEAVEGKASLLCLPYPGQVLTMRQLDVVLEPGRQYRLSVHFRTEQCKRGRFTGIFLIDEGWFSTHGSTIRPPEGDSDWQAYHKTFVPKPSRTGKYQIIVVPPGQGKLWLDDIRIEDAGAGATGRNLVVNPGFENGWAGWMESIHKFRPFLDAVIAKGHKFAPEFYMDEQATEEAARSRIESRLVETMQAWRKHYAGIERHLLITFSAGNSALRYSNDKFPNVSYKVLLDMQFHALANEPAFEDLWGAGFWSGHYIDEELMRWYAALFRHYLIEGRRERLSQDPYILQHLDNPGFEEGAKGWSFQPGAGGSVEVVQVKNMPQNGGRQKYCPVPEGKHVLRTRRTAAARNVISQTIKNLEPGRLYSLKLYRTDPGYSNRPIPVSIVVQGAQLQDTKMLDHVWQKGKIYWNYHCRVFRAKSAEARLSIADAAPGDVFWDFVQVEPYLEEE